MCPFSLLCLWRSTVYDSADAETLQVYLPTLVYGRGSSCGQQTSRWALRCPYMRTWLSTASYRTMCQRVLWVRLHCLLLACSAQPEQPEH